jgi:hypothetical protein
MVETIMLAGQPGTRLGWKDNPPSGKAVRKNGHCTKQKINASGYQLNPTNKPCNA